MKKVPNMKYKLRKVAYFSKLFVNVTTVIFVVLSVHSGKGASLSGRDSTSLNSRSCCDPNAFCACKEDYCRNLSCQPCSDLQGQVYLCKGKGDNWLAIEGCWQSGVESSSCHAEDYWIETDCVVDLWVGESCVGDPDSEGWCWMARECK
jgi:hypothetical protein